MKQRPTIAALLLVLLGGLALSAADPWKEAPYTEWTEKQVEKILEKSPWAKEIHQATRARRSTGSPRMEGVGVVGMPVNIGAMRHALTVTWYSALTVRQALARQRQLQDAPAPAGEDDLLQPLEHYEIRIHGPAISSCCPGTRECFLRPRRSEREIPPANVRFLVQPDGSWTEVRFAFPRMVDGTPAIGPEEKKVEFHCQSADGPFEAEFDLRKMTRDAAPDL